MTDDRSVVAEDLERTTAARRDADDAAARARDEQTLAIRRAIEIGIPVTAIKATTGLSLARIYQIRDGRR